ncbi:MAG: hypothetical protein FWH01_09900 [Oscillospiraceae bacterium]|nr:hypothetical protein [Oscillospiraceae bacterium]
MQFGDFKSDMDDKVIEIISTSKTTAEAAADWDAWLETMKPKIQLILDELEASDVPKINSY